MRRTIFFALAALAASACARRPGATPPPEPSPAENMPSEASFREACDAGVTDACLAAGVLLARGEWGPDRAADALVMLDRQCADRAPGSCAAALLTAIAHPSLPTPEQLDRAELGACADGHPYACQLRAERLSDADPAQAMTAWKAGCAAGSAYACAVVDGSWPPPAPSDLAVPPEFTDLLTRADMRFTPPPRFRAVPVRDNPDMGYQLAIQSEDGSVELRYRVDPLDTFQAEYAECQQRPGCVSATPDNIASGLALINALNISAGEPAPYNEFPQPAIFLEFNADHGGVAAFVPRETFAPGWANGAIVALHRDGVGLGTVVLLFNDAAAGAIAWESAFHALRFATPRGP